MKRLIAGLLLTLMLTAGCGAAHKIAAKVSCLSTVRTWYKSGGKADSDALKSALLAVGRADRAAGKAHFTPATVSAVKAKTGALSAAIARFGSDLPPGCVSGVRADMKAGLADFRKAVTDQDAAVAAARRNDAAGVQQAFTRAASAFKAGAVKFLAVGAAVKKYLAH